MPNRKIMDVIRNKPLVVGFLDTTVLDAAKQMAEKGVGSVVVIANGQLAGIFTERDLLNRIIAKELNPAKVCLAHVMTSTVIGVEFDKPFTHALHLMSMNNCRHIPVTMKGMPVGMVTARDALTIEWQDFDKEHEEADHISEILA